VPHKYPNIIALSQDLNNKQKKSILVKQSIQIDKIVEADFRHHSELCKSLTMKILQHNMSITSAPLGSWNL
jgi:hypothetical protein